MLLSIVHLPEDWPRWMGWLRPNWLLLVLFFWVLEVPHRVGLVAMWCVGLFVDVLTADPIGLNGAVLATITYIGWQFFERLRMYSVVQQGLIVFVLATAAEVAQVMVLDFGSDHPWAWSLLLSPLMTMLVWPFVFLLLLRLRTGVRVE